MRLFYIIAPIGLIDIVKQELEIKWALFFPDSDFEIKNQDIGGIEVSCGLEQGLALNQILKTPTRILLRIKEQKCRDLPKLFNILKKINWKEYLKQTNIDFKISSKNSRLLHTKKIEKSAIDALNAYFMANKLPRNSVTIPKNQKVFLRFLEDTLTISLDTSGDRLDETSKSFKGKANIRETYASALLLHLLGYNKYQDYQLIDPMCGSATFLRSAKNFYDINEKEFAYQNWNIKDLKLNPISTTWNFHKYIGHDIDEEIITKLKTLYPFFNLKVQDCFNLEPQPGKNIVIINPPYGKRIKIKGPLKEYYDSLIDTIDKVYNPVKFGIIIPDSITYSRNDFDYFRFNQNGIMVKFWYRS